MGTEWEFLLEFAGCHTFTWDLWDLGKEQLRALWTALCFHEGMEVDTRAYDDAVGEVWRCMTDDDDWGSFEEFEDFMCALMV